MSNVVSEIQHEILHGDDLLGDDIVEFFLRYQGPLPTCSRTASRTPEKDEIRRRLSPQLKDLWEKHPGLNERIWAADSVERIIKGRGVFDQAGEPNKSPCYHIPFKGWKFIPLVVRARRWVCELKITFLRRHEPGDIIGGGDIDNRLKTLFDALRIPGNVDETVGEHQDGADDKVFCLLEDDALITSLSVDTERLYGPIDASSSEADVNILMRVTIKKYNRDLGFI
jgi:hypothetical protein